MGTTEGESIMCAGCMEIVTLIHDETTVADPSLSRTVMDSLRHATLVRDKVQITDEQIATFLIILGGSLLVWEAE
jgi:hypothetical protein